MTKRRTSESHVIAVVKLDNGELIEDILERESVEQAAANSDRVIDAKEMAESPDRPDPASRVPGTLPRDNPAD
jgi:hypothetical protein